MLSNRAFTLLELLVVITIIGILASIVVVSMSGSTDSATIAKGKAYAQQVHALLGHQAVLDLNFNENATGTCPDGKDVCDASGYNNNGTIYGASFVSSPVDGYALSFDGVDDYVDCGNDESLDTPNAVTVELWAKWTTQDGYNSIIRKGNPSSDRPNNYLLQIDPNGKLQFTYSRESNNNDWIMTVNSYNDGNWHHIVAVLDTVDLVRGIYVDGILVKSASASSELALTNDFNLYIATRIYTPDTAYFSGLIDEARIYLEVLPTTEIQKHYVQGLEKLLANQAITRAEYDQRMEEFNQSLASI
jgi:prepilin-type N-terminal cleavage/methylation domain-containing protein